MQSSGREEPKQLVLSTANNVIANNCDSRLSRMALAVGRLSDWEKAVFLQ